MGIAILSGVVASLDPSHAFPKWESHTPGTLTPSDSPDATVPSRFIACVNREESAAKLRTIFTNLQGRSVEVFVSQNLQAIQQADVVLLWYAVLCSWISSLTVFVCLAASLSWHTPSWEKPESRKFWVANF
jgi:hypothetical protein